MDDLLIERAARATFEMEHRDANGAFPKTWPTLAPTLKEHQRVKVRFVMKFIESRLGKGIAL